MNFKARTSFTTFVVVAMLLSAVGWFAASRSEAQTGGLRREPGLILTRGTFVELTCGGTINANDAVYLDSSGNVEQAATSAQTTTLIGVANAGCVSGGTTQVQYAGKATVVADATVAVGDRVGAPTSTAGRVKTVASTLAGSVATGGTTVTSSAANGAIVTVTGDPGTSRVLGRALTGGNAGASIIILLTIG
jgi:hypothetical protein